MTKQQQIHRYREQTSGCHWREGRQRDKIEIYSTIYKISQEDT